MRNNTIGIDALCNIDEKYIIIIISLYIVLEMNHAYIHACKKVNHLISASVENSHRYIFGLTCWFSYLRHFEGHASKHR